MATPARRLALRILLALEAEPQGPTLAEHLAQPEVEALEPRERAFLHELVLGTLRQRGRVDHALAGHSRQTLDHLEAPVRAVLRLGAYQILLLRVPDRAAVSESVELCREALPRATGFVNAVLRALARAGAPPLPDPASDPLAWLVSAGSLPHWLAERWLARLGAETALARASALLETPPAVFRVNPRRPVDLAALAPRALGVPGAFAAEAGRTRELAAEAAIYVQDQGSQLVAQLAAAPGRVLDACAAPGGKSLLIADLVGASGRVTAADVSSRRLRALADLARAWGAANVHIVGADALRPPFAQPFDSVLLDAPCSGLGTLGRHPDVRWRVTPEDVERHARRQRAMLEAIAALVRPGGRLVYSVCSAEREENEDVAIPFHAAHPELVPLPLPAWAAAFSDGAYARTRPERDGGDAFFAASFVRS